MKPRRLKELLTFAIIHKAPDYLSVNKKELLESALMKLNTDELEALEEYVGAVEEINKGQKRKRNSSTEENEDLISS